MRATCLALLSATLLAVPLRGEEPTGDSLKQVVRGNQQFALELYQQLSRKEGNLFFSPYSISAALAMTYAGARSTTAEQMASTLHFPTDQDRLHPAMARLARIINDPDNKKRGYQLTTANALWGQKGYPFLPDFLQLTQKYYDAGLTELDFARQTEKARTTINEWVEEKTNDRIKDLLKPGILTPDTRLVLTNAIYFKGDWASQFKKDATREATFHLADGQSVKTPMMHQTLDCGYTETPQMQVLEMAYAGKDLSMVVLLPRKVDGLAEIEKSLGTAQLDRVLAQLRSREVEVAIPRFKTTATFSLGETLAKMGMPQAFSDSADFSGMSRESLQISAVVHQAFVDVNEEGTEAAAATGVIIRPTAAPIRLTFRADHPFLFLIRDQRTGSLLFLGRLSSPGAAGS